MSKLNETSSAKVKILIAEDSLTQAEQLRYLLEENDYDVTVARNGRLALTQAREIHPALIISDVVMPELDGYGLCREVKADSSMRDTPLILLTSLSSPQDVLKGLECGADSFLRKPYDEKHLLTRVQQVLMNHNLRGSEVMRAGIEISLSGQRHLVTAERQQILDLLISTYEEAVRLNEDLTASNRELEARNREVERASKFKDAFLSTMSHELRTPLSSVLGFSELLLEGGLGPLTEEQRVSVSTIESAGRHLLRLTNDILDLSRIEAGRMELIFGPMVVDKVVTEVISTLKPLAERKSQKLFYRDCCESPVRADDTRIRQVLTNLLGNAIKFTPDGGSIEVRAGREGQRVRLAVIDTGPGIPLLERQRIFEAFYRLRQHEHSVEGTGLGLAITQKLVELHDSRLELDSPPEGGSCFSFALPLEMAANAHN